MAVSLFDPKTSQVYDAPDEATAEAQQRAYGLEVATPEQIAAHDAQLRSGGTLDQLRTVGETAIATGVETVGGLAQAATGGKVIEKTGSVFSDAAKERREVNPNAALVGAAIPDIASAIATPQLGGASLLGKAANLVARSAVAGAVAEGGETAIEGDDYSLTDAGLYGLAAGALDVGGSYAFGKAMKAAGKTKDALGNVVEKARRWAVDDALNEPDKALRSLKMGGDDVQEVLFERHQTALDDALDVIDQRMADAPEKLFTPAALKRNVSENFQAQSDHFLETAVRLQHAAEASGVAEVAAARDVLQDALESNGPQMYRAVREARTVLEAADLADSPLGQEVFQALDESLRNENVWGKAAKNYAHVNDPGLHAGAKSVGARTHQRFKIDDLDGRATLTERLDAAQAMATATGDKKALKAIAQARKAMAGADDITGARVMGADVPVDQWENTAQGRAARNRQPGTAETGGLWNKAKNFANEVGEEEVGGVVEGGFKQAGMAIGGALGGLPGMGLGYLAGRALNKRYGGRASQFAWKALKKGAGRVARENPLRTAGGFAGAAMGASVGGPLGAPAALAGAYVGQRAARAVGDAARGAAGRVKSAAKKTVSKTIGDAVKESAEKRAAAAAAEAPGMRWTQTAPGESVDEMFARRAKEGGKRVEDMTAAERAEVNDAFQKRQQEAAKRTAGERSGAEVPEVPKAEGVDVKVSDYKFEGGKPPAEPFRSADDHLSYAERLAQTVERVRAAAKVPDLPRGLSKALRDVADKPGDVLGDAYRRAKRGVVGDIYTRKVSEDEALGYVGAAIGGMAEEAEDAAARGAGKGSTWSARREELDRQIDEAEARFKEMIEAERAKKLSKRAKRALDRASDAIKEAFERPSAQRPPARWNRRTRAAPQAPKQLTAGEQAMQVLAENPEKIAGAALTGYGTADAALNPDEADGANTAAASAGLLALFLPKAGLKVLAHELDNAMGALKRSEKAAMVGAAKRALEANEDLLRKFARKEAGTLSADQVMFKQFENIANEYAKITKRAAPSMEDTSNPLWSAIEKHIDFHNASVIENDAELLRLAKIGKFDVLPGGGQGAIPPMTPEARAELVAQLRAKERAKLTDAKGAALTEADQDLLNKHFGSDENMLRDHFEAQDQAAESGLKATNPLDVKISEAPKMPQLGGASAEQGQAARQARFEGALEDLADFKHGATVDDLSDTGRDMLLRDKFPGPSLKWMEEAEHDLVLRMGQTTTEDELYRLAREHVSDWEERFKITYGRDPDPAVREYVEARLNMSAGEEQARLQKIRGVIGRDEERMAAYRKKLDEVEVDSAGEGAQLLEDLPEQAQDVWNDRLRKMEDDLLAADPKAERGELGFQLGRESIVTHLEDKYGLSARDEVFIRKALDDDPPFDANQLDDVINDAVNTSAGYHDGDSLPELTGDDIVHMINAGETRLGNHDLTPWEEYHVRKEFDDGAHGYQEHFEELVEEYESQTKNEFAKQYGYDDAEAMDAAHAAAEEGDASLLMQGDDHYDEYKEIADEARLAGTEDRHAVKAAKQSRGESNERLRRFQENFDNRGQPKKQSQPATGHREPGVPDGLPPAWALENIGLRGVEMKDFDAVRDVFGDDLTVRDLRQLMATDAFEDLAKQTGQEIDSHIGAYPGKVVMRNGTRDGFTWAEYSYNHAPEGIVANLHAFLIPREGMNGKLAGKVLRPMFEVLDRRGANVVTTNPTGYGRFVFPKLGFDPGPQATGQATRAFADQLDRWGFSKETLERIPGGLPKLETLQDIADFTIPKTMALDTGPMRGHSLRTLVQKYKDVAEEFGLKPDVMKDLFDRDQFLAGKAWLMANNGPWHQRAALHVGSPEFKKAMGRLGLLGAAGVGGYEALKAMQQSPMTFSEDGPGAAAQLSPEQQAQFEEESAQEEQKQQTRAQLDYLKAQSHNALTSAANALAGNTPNTRTVPRRAGVSNSAGVNTFMGNNTNMTAAFEEKRAGLQKLQQDPMILVDEMTDSFSGMADAAPGLHRQMVAQTYKVAAFLNQKMPGTIGASLTRPKGTPPNPFAVRQFALYYSAATNPSTVLTDLTHNRAQKEQVDTLKELWPDTYAQLKDAMLDRMANNNGKPPNYAARARIDLLFDFGESLDTALSGRLVATLDAYKKSPEGQGKAKPDGSAAPPPSMPSRRSNPSIQAAGALGSLHQGPTSAAA